MTQPIKIIDHLIDFPRTRQSTDYSCGASCVQSILYYYGDDYMEETLIREMKVKPTHIEHSGVVPQVISDYLTKFGFKAPIIQPMTFDDLRRFIDQNIPVIVAMQAWNDIERIETFYKNSYANGHYIVAIGYGEDFFVFNDPSTLGNHSYLSNTDFWNRWHDEDSKGNKFDKLGIPVYGKKPVFESAMLLRIK